MNIADQIELSPDVVAREVGGETMLLDLASGTYFGLDAIGGRVWQVLEDGGSLEEACDRIEAEYEVSRSQLETDVLALVEDLRAKGLVASPA